MIKERAWPARAMYMLIAAALAISLMIMAAPAQKVSAAPNDVVSEWERASTPTTEGWVLAPESVIYDYALASDGEVAYAIVECWYHEGEEDLYGFRLLKSSNHGATWKDITDELDDVIDPDNEDYNYLDDLLLVATDWENEDFVAVALWWYDEYDEYYLHVFFSTDGGTTFEDAGEVEEDDVYLDYVSDLIVSPEAGGRRDIAIGGDAWDDNYSEYVCGLFRCTVTGDSAGSWVDATTYDGWDDNGAFNSTFVTDLIFSRQWVDDDTILAVTVVPEYWDYDYAYGAIYLQSGAFGRTSGAWNAESDFPDAVPVKEDVWIPEWLFYGYGEQGDGRGIAGVVLPQDYLGVDPDERCAWVWMNYYDDDIEKSQGEILRVIDEAVYSVDTQIPKMPWLTNVSYVGYIDEGKAIAGVLADSAEYMLYEEDLVKGCCPKVAVWRNGDIRNNMEICCEDWDSACKPPTGQTAMAVSYVSNDPAEEKAYAVALQGVLDYDEGAWSVTFDGGDTWNQLSLIDTNIDYLSDVAVSPDCNKMMLVSVNIEKVCIDYEDRTGCDSVWLKADTLHEAEEYNGEWLRTWSGELVGDNSVHFCDHPERGFLRLAPEEQQGDEVRTVYLVDRMSDTLYWNDLETLGCWKERSAGEIANIVDLAVKDASTIYALDYMGDVVMSDDHGTSRSWIEAVDSEVEYGWTIAVWGDHILVGGEDGEVAYSDDGGETFTLLEEDPTIYGMVTVAFDTYFDTNMTVYAATMRSEENGIYRWVIDESEKWKDLRAEDLHYTGLVVDSPENPFTGPETGGVIYASYTGLMCQESDCWSGEECWETGVARRLYPLEDKICGVCGEWDYLTLGLTGDEEFYMAPDALKICGCLSPDTNSKLFAIGMQDEGEGWWYDMDEAMWGTVWTFEDCYAKKAPTITFPANGDVIPADPCSCYSVPFSILWDRLCDACSYDIQFALDPDFDMLVEVNGETPAELLDWVISGQDPAFSILGGLEGGLSCETTYYVRVRAANAENCELIHSWWSEAVQFTIAPEVSAGMVDLIAPEPGALNVPVEDVGFSWDLQATADAFDWVLSENADLSSPLDSKTGLTNTAASYVGTLEYATTYYWQVTAHNEGSMVGMSAVGTFTTMAEPDEPYVPPEDGTPFWVWVVIAIGAVLVIVVIVLIFRTRRV